MTNLLKHFPGGIEVLAEERSVMSLTWECNGEAMHEEWQDGETLADAVLMLYERIKKARGE